MARRQVGEVFEITLPSGRLAYAQHTHDDADGRILRILDGLHDEPIGSAEVAAAGADRFYAHFDPEHPLREGWMRRVGPAPVPGRVPGFPGFKHAERDPATGRAIGWEVDDGVQVRFRERLTDAERRYSQDGILADDYLVELIESGWRPEDDTDEPPPGWDDDDAPAERGLEHFAYFADADSARRAGEVLAGRGWETEVDVRPDECFLGVVSPGDDDGEPDVVAEVVERHGGDYDGYGSGG